MALISGTRLGPYEIQSPLGAGGMGEVYRALDTRLDRIVAVKILSPRLSEDPEAKARFDREARTISSLNHPNICTLHDVGHQNGVDYLVMEYLEGETLASRLKKGPVAPGQALKYGIEICEGLEMAHRTGVVHRDLKPGNIMLTKTGVKLMDFGLAKSLPGHASATSGLTVTVSSTDANSPLTEKGMVIGTFQYMSPEQVQGKEVDGRSDIFSLGAVLYEMVTGKRAFEGKNSFSVATAILESEPAPIGSVKLMTSAVLEHAIVLQKVIRPAALRAGNPESGGWHTFLHSYSTLLIANGENVKVVQELMRHANSRSTLEIYSQARIEHKRKAQQRLAEAIFRDEDEIQIPVVQRVFDDNLS